jgi:trehalose synthase
VARSVEQFIPISGPEQVAALHQKLRPLYGTTNLHINSSFRGGGVAEILLSTVPMLNTLGLDSGWRVIHGTEEYYEITKTIHNAMQGNTTGLSDQDLRVYTKINEDFATYTHIDHDYVIIHDPQPLPLIRHFKKRQPWIWRCHIDLSNPNPEVWGYLKGFLVRYDVVVVSSDRYVRDDLPVEQRVIRPAIDALSEKNREMSDDEMSAMLEEAGIRRDKPFLTQVSRMDPWKDPEGVLEIYRRVRDREPCRLVFVYNLADDDPEGQEIYRRVREKADDLVEQGEVIFVYGSDPRMVNAIQRAAAVVLQNSIREGFCLTVTEAMWKASAVVATTAGGIPEQIVDGENGYLVEPEDYDAAAGRVLELLGNPDRRREIGRAAKESVRTHFLTTRLLSDYLDLMADLRG